MKKTAFILFVLILFPGGVKAIIKQDNPEHEFKWAGKTGARKMPSGKKVYNVSDFGARNDGVTLNTSAIQTAIDGSGPTTDGIDIDSSSWILVENCDIDCNDDDFCLKAGRDADGLRVNRPTEYVVIRNCVARRGAGLITCGSETSGGIRNVHLWNMRGTVRGSAVSISGMKESPVENFFLTGIDVEARSPGEISFAKGWRFKNVSIKSSGTEELRVKESIDMETEITVSDK